MQASFEPKGIHELDGTQTGHTDKDTQNYKNSHRTKKMLEAVSSSGLLEEHSITPTAILSSFTSWHGYFGSDTSQTVKIGRFLVIT